MKNITITKEYQFTDVEYNTWEHDGMMDDPAYARMAVKKIESYEANGIYPGERLILTFETSETFINTNIIRDMAERYLK